MRGGGLKGCRRVFALLFFELFFARRGWGEGKWNGRQGEQQQPKAVPSTRRRDRFTGRDVNLSLHLKKKKNKQTAIPTTVHKSCIPTIYRGGFSQNIIIGFQATLVPPLWSFLQTKNLKTSWKFFSKHSVLFADWKKKSSSSDSWPFIFIGFHGSTDHCRD